MRGVVSQPAGASAGGRSSCVGFNASVAGQTSRLRRPSRKTTFTVGMTGDLNSANPFRQFENEWEVRRPDVRRPGSATARRTTRRSPSWPTDGTSATTAHLDVPPPGRPHLERWRPDHRARLRVDGELHHRATTSARGATATRTPRASRPSTIRRSCGRPPARPWSPALPGYNLMLPEHVWGGFVEEGG